MSAGDLHGRLASLLENPFLVLELPADADGASVERQAQRLLGMLAAGVAGATHYDTPLGPRQRSAETVRLAASELRDPDRRLAHEWWARGWADGHGQRDAR